MKIKVVIIKVLCVSLLQPALSQEKRDVIGLLIECYQFMYAPEAVVFKATKEAKDVYTCIERPSNFYEDFSDVRIGFDILTQIREVNTFSFQPDIDSVSAPLKIPLRITSKHGEKRANGSIHQGIDFGVNIGDTVYSSFCGEVRIEKFDPSGYGNVVVVRNYNMSETLYGHLDKSLVRNGQKVVTGQPIGIGGNSGTSTGPHLHFEIRSSGYSFNPMLDGKFFKKFAVTY